MSPSLRPDHTGPTRTQAARCDGQRFSEKCPPSTPFGSRRSGSGRAGRGGTRHVARRLDCSITCPLRTRPRRLRLAASALTTMMLALGLGLTAPAGAQVSGTVVLYEDINYGGASRGFVAGSYSNIGSAWNDRASSIRVPSGTVVSVYVDGG